MVEWNWMRDFLYNFGFLYEQQTLHNESLPKAAVFKDRRVYAYHIATAMNLMQEDYADRMSVVGNQGRHVCESFCAVFAPSDNEFPTRELADQIRFLETHRADIFRPELVTCLHILCAFGNAADHVHTPEMKPADKPKVVDALYALVKVVYDFFRRSHPEDSERAATWAMERLKLVGRCEWCRCEGRILNGTCVLALRAHTRGVNSVMQLADGRICSGSADRTIKIWDACTGACVLTLSGHEGPATSVTQLADGRICSGSTDKTVKIWDFGTGACVLTLSGHKSGVLSVTQLADGRICSGGADGRVKIWDASSGACDTLNIRYFCVGPVYSVTQLADGRICASYNKTVEIWDLGTRACVLTLEGHTNVVNSVTQLADGRICSASNDETIKIWDFGTGACKQTLSGPSRVYSVTQLADGRICGGCYDGTVKIWDLGTGACVLTLKRHKKWVNSVTQLADGRICSGSDDGTIKI